MSNVEGASKEQHENHVKFKIEEEEIKGHHESLEITELGENKFNVNLGYLKMDHYYRVIESTIYFDSIIKISH